MIRSFLSDLKDDHKTHIKLKVNTGNKVIYYKTQQGEWKIQLSMTINFISSKYIYIYIYIYIL